MVQKKKLCQHRLAMPMDPLAKLPDPMTLTVAARGGTVFAFQRSPRGLSGVESPGWEESRAGRLVDP